MELQGDLHVAVFEPALLKNMLISLMAATKVFSFQGQVGPALLHTGGVIYLSIKMGGGILDTLLNIYYYCIYTNGR